MKKTFLSGTITLGFLSFQAMAGENDWPVFGGGPGGMQYSALDQITPENVENLEVAWTYRFGQMTDYFSLQTNPILVEGKLYVSTATVLVAAIDPATGQEIWKYDGGIDTSHGYSERSNRGVSSWIDTNVPAGTVCRHRIYIGTIEAELISLDGETGKPCEDFGINGAITLTHDVRFNPDDEGDYNITSPPVIVGDVVISGSAIGDNRAVELEYGIVRGFDARTGAELWRWDPIPRSPDDPAYSTWRPDQVEKTGAANAWPPLSADIERGFVYVPTGSPSPDFYGGERIGDTLYANSLVALNATTGEMVWYRQLVHHDVWDYDLASQPTLVELEHNGEIIPAVIQGTKMGLVFTFNRITGEPIFDVEERPVPQGGVAGEALSPTQPFPVAPPPVVPNAPVTAGDAWGMLYFDENACAEEMANYRSEGLYSPPSLEGTLMQPGYTGGINWGGIAFDPESQVAVMNPNNLMVVVQLIPRNEFEELRDSGLYPDSQFTAMYGTPYGMRRRVLTSSLDVPCNAPPWGSLVAIDMKKGEILWNQPFGTIEDITPAIVPNLKLGTPGVGGPIITGGGLIFVGAALDDYLRAFDLATGEELWKGRLPAGGQATPMTYYLEETGKQYVVIAAGGNPNTGTTMGDYIIAFTLGKGKKRTGC